MYFYPALSGPPDGTLRCSRCLFPITTLSRYSSGSLASNAASSARNIKSVKNVRMQRTGCPVSADIEIIGNINKTEVEAIFGLCSQVGSLEIG